MTQVECAAIISHGVIFYAPRPARHSDLIKAMAQLGVPTPIDGTSMGGFGVRTDAGELKFQSRWTSKVTAYFADQITRDRFLSKRVFCTEDLW